MIIEDLRDLPLHPAIAIIINVGTKVCTTLALLSTLRYARIPSVIVDCESRDGSPEWFAHLMSLYDFHVVKAPLKEHGQTLDWVFRGVQADRVLLVDSDVEVLNSKLINQMNTAIGRSGNIFGSGYLHPASWLEYHYDTGFPIAQGIGYYRPRPWIPFTLLRVTCVRKALADGRSFIQRLELNEMGSSPLIARILWQRFRLKYFRNHKLRFLNPIRTLQDGHRPAYVQYDTGAEIHDYLTNQGLLFAALSNAEEVPESIKHLGGVTRSVLNGKSDNAIPLSTATKHCQERLFNEYGVDVST